MKTFKVIQLFRKAGLWNYCLVMFKRAETLDKYYRVYEFAINEKLQGKYGYIRRTLESDQVQALLPKPSRTYEGWDVHSIKWVIQEMEREIWV